MCHFNLNIVCIWYESSRGKNPSDGAGGHVKGVLSYAVSAGKEVMRNAQEVDAFCKHNLTVQNGRKKMLTRDYFFVTEDELNNKRKLVAENSYRPVKDYLKKHQAITTSNKGTILAWNLACFCEACYNGEPNNCSILNDKENPMYSMFNCESKNNICYVKHKWLKNGEESSSDSDNADDIDMEDEELHFQLSTAVEMVSVGSVIVVRANDDYSSYYLIKVINPPCILEENSKDNYGHTFASNTEVISGHYFEIHGHWDDCKYFLDTENVCYISTFCIAGICPELEVVPGKRRGKSIDVYCASPDINEALMEICKAAVI